MKILITLVIGFILGAVALWLFRADDPAVTLQEAEERATQEMRQTGDTLRDTGEQTREAWDARLEALQLRAEDIRDELAEDSQVIRRKARDFGESTVDVAVDARITGVINAKLVADEELSVFDVAVSTTGRQVTLSGTVASPELIGRATALALQTDGVQEVVSTLRVE